MKKIYFLIMLGIIISAKIYSQGCIGMRSPGGSSMFLYRPGYPSNSSPERVGPKSYGRMYSAKKKESTSGWSLSASNRYFESFRHFSGTDEQTKRYKDGTEVINKSYTLDLSATRIFNPRWSLSVNVPVNINDRSSLYEHSDGLRHSTGDGGVGDVRVTAYRWLLDPKKSKTFNVQEGWV